jgi:plasmid stabilization system protein ParE
MKYEVQISDKAEDDLDSIIDYMISKLKAPRAADNFIRLLEEKIESIEVSPKAYKIIDDEKLSVDEIRVVQVNNYLVFFMIDDKKKVVSIIRVLYGRRDWLNILLIEEI